MRYLIIVLSLFLITCGGGGGGGGSAPTEPTDPYVVNIVSLAGAAQKGPFNNGTIINIAELNNSLAPTGRNFTSQIIDNSGTFSVANVQMEFSFAQINASGFYFNEVGNQVSSAQLVLSGLSNLTNKTNMNVNVLSNLEMNRLKNLLTANSSLTFNQAKIQAQEEVLAIFDYSRAGMAESELLDITKAGVGNAKLLAISAILQDDRTVGQLSELLANISTDITADGILNDTSIIQSLLQSAYNLDLEAIRTNLEARYASLGLTVTIPNFETEVNNFYKPPTVNDMNTSTDEDTPINITLDGSDPENQSLTYSTVEVNNATVTISGNVANYEPVANWNGTDTFTYIANDGSFNSNTAIVTVTVGGVDDEPNTNDINTTTDEDVSVVMNLTADEYDGQNYSFSIISNPSNGTATLSGTQVTYAPNQDWHGTDTFTFEATDDRTARTNVATATITVNPVNDAPIANDVTTSTTENLFNRNNINIDITYDADNDILFNGDIKGTSSFSNSNSVDITLDGTDVDGDNLTYSVVATNNGSVTISGAIATYEPTQDWNGTDTFTYKANDGSLDSNTATATITVNAVNDAPTTTAGTISTNEDTAGTIDLSTISSDIDGDNLTYSVVSNASNGTTSISGAILTYTANQDWNGTDIFTYRANDGTVNSGTGTVIVTVVAVNDVPTSADEGITTNEDTAVRTGFSSSDVETSSSDLTYSVVTQPSNGTVTIDNANSEPGLYTPTANWNGTDTFTYKANDGTVDSNTATATVTVAAVNDAPTTTDISTTIDENRTARMVGITLQGSDVEGDNLTYSVVSNASNGTTSISGATLTYTANQDWNGTETITYKANDGTLDSNTSTITVTVNAVNDTPVVTTQDGDNSKSLDFDGNNDWVNMGTSAGVFTSVMTVQAWAKADALQSNKHIVSKGIDTNSSHRAYSLMAPYATEDFSGAKDNWIGTMVVSNTEYQLTSSTAATLNAWAHLVMTYDGSNIKLYVNGTLEDTQAATGNIGGSQSSNQKFLVGDHNTSKSQYNFDGSIDGVAIWNIALTASNVTTLYNSGDGEAPSAVENSNLQGYWNFEDNANDLTSNNNDGSVNGATYVSDVPAD